MYRTPARKPVKLTLSVHEVRAIVCQHLKDIDKLPMNVAPADAIVHETAKVDICDRWKADLLTFEFHPKDEDL